MGKRIHISIIASALSLYSFAGINVDSLIHKISQLNFYCVPTLAYQPETGYAFGVGGGYYFKYINPTKISSFTFNTNITQRHQFSFSASPRLYIDYGNWYVFSNISIQNYPNSYHGIGNAISDLLTPPIVYSSRSFAFILQPQRYLTKHLLMGLLFSIKSEKTIVADSLRYRTLRTHVAGWNPYFMLGLGGEISYDSRNMLFYPTKGIFSKLAVAHYDPSLGSTYDMTVVRFDFRQYIPIYQQQVFAWQFYTDWRLGNLIPFQMLTTIGGIDMMRGFSQDIFRDNTMAAIQGEYRFPIYDIWRGAVFCSTGDVFNNENFMIDKLKISYGAGVRFRITKANINFRFDLTRNNYYKGVQYYITAMEAF